MMAKANRNAVKEAAEIKAAPAEKDTCENSSDHYQLNINTLTNQGVSTNCNCF